MIAFTESRADLVNLHNFCQKISLLCHIDKYELIMYNNTIKHSFKYGSAPVWAQHFRRLL